MEKRQHVRDTNSFFLGHYSVCRLAGSTELSHCSLGNNRQKEKTRQAERETADITTHGVLSKWLTVTHRNGKTSASDDYGDSDSLHLVHVISFAQVITWLGENIARMLPESSDNVAICNFPRDGPMLVSDFISDVSLHVLGAIQDFHDHQID